MKKKIVILGAGLVGKAMAIDLAASFDVTSVDIHDEALKQVEKHGIKRKRWISLISIFCLLSSPVLIS